MAEDTNEPRQMPDHVKKPNHLDARYYKTVEGKTVFNQKRWSADNAFYQKWLNWKNGNSDVNL